MIFSVHFCDSVQAENLDAREEARNSFRATHRTVPNRKLIFGHSNVPISTAYHSKGYAMNGSRTQRHRIHASWTACLAVNGFIIGTKRKSSTAPDAMMNHWTCALMGNARWGPINSKMLIASSKTLNVYFFPPFLAARRLWYDARLTGTWRQMSKMCWWWIVL